MIVRGQPSHRLCCQNSSNPGKHEHRRAKDDPKRVRARSPRVGIWWSLAWIAFELVFNDSEADAGLICLA
jgi:hypothetical protein